MRKLLVILVAIVAGGGLSLWAAYQFGFFKPTDGGNQAATGVKPHGDGTATAAAGGPVSAPGKLKPAGGVVDISGLPGDRLVALKVHEGEEVKKDQLLAVLESSALRKAEHELAQQQLKEAEQRQTAEEAYAAALQIEAGLALEQVELEEHDLSAQKQKIAVLTTQQQSAHDDLLRLEALRNADDGETVADQTYEHQKLLLDKTSSELEAAQGQYTKLDASIKLARRQAQAKIATAEANRGRIPSTVQVDTLRKSAKLAEQRFEMTSIKAPFDGRILKIMVNQGATLSQQPILQMADTSRMVVIAEIYERDVVKVKENDSASVEIKALEGQVFRGQVTYVGRMVAQTSTSPMSPAAPTDRHVVEARIELDSAEPANRFINMQVTVRIPAKDAAPSAGQPTAAAAHPTSR